MKSSALTSAAKVYVAVVASAAPTSPKRGSVTAVIARK